MRAEAMYYDLAASLPHIPHFERVRRLPITSLRLQQRLALLSPPHATQLRGALSVVRWRPVRLLSQTDEEWLKACDAFLKSRTSPALRPYVQQRRDQQAILAALRWRLQGADLPRAIAVLRLASGQALGRFGDSDLALPCVHPWIPRARELLAAGDAQELERQTMRIAWRWLDRIGEQDMFGFAAVAAYVFKWDILQSWLARSAGQATAKFSQLVDQVIHA